MRLVGRSLTSAPAMQSSSWGRIRAPEFLSEISVAVVAALETGDRVGAIRLADRLSNLEARARAEGDENLATYFGALGRLLAGEDATASAANLVEPYRSGYERIRQELDAAHREAATSPDWLATLTSIVASTARHGSQQDRHRLEQNLVEIARRNAPGDEGFPPFVDALRAVLRGEDTRQRVVVLQTPYREAFLSLLQILAAEDTTDFTHHALLDRIRHNTIVALLEGNREVQAAVATTLADLVSQLTTDDKGHLRALLEGAEALLRRQQPPPAVDTLPEPYAGVWHDILTAAEK
jgi:hypothetical protein